MPNALKVQEYLRSGKTVIDLEKEFGITCKTHPEYPELVMLKYSMIDSPMGERICQECRGIILNQNDNWNIVSFPFTKFFNFSEIHAATIDWASAKVLEKLDGSLMCLYVKNDKWHVSSSGLPDAGGKVDKTEMTFKELFWDTFNSLGYKLPRPAYNSHCFMFELMTPFNRIIVPHAENKLVMIGSRNLVDNQELGSDFGLQFGWQVVKSFPLGTLEDCLKAAQELKGVDSEGFVVVDKYYNRVKIKSPVYITLAHMKDNLTDRGMLRIIVTNEGSEFLGYFPEYRPLYEKIKEKYDFVIKSAEADYERIKHFVIQKDFALEAIKTSYSSILFALRSGKVASVRDFLANAGDGVLEKIILGEKTEVINV